MIEVCTYFEGDERVVLVGADDADDEVNAARVAGEAAVQRMAHLISRGSADVTDGVEIDVDFHANGERWQGTVKVDFRISVGTGRDGEDADGPALGTPVVFDENEDEP